MQYILLYVFLIFNCICLVHISVIMQIKIKNELISNGRGFYNNLPHLLYDR